MNELLPGILSSEQVGRFGKEIRISHTTTLQYRDWEVGVTVHLSLLMTDKTDFLYNGKASPFKKP